ncbi:MAG TPA: CHASE2 domain-containing protein, partial [Stenomitos sp.]
DELRYGLKKALAQGLKIAIFNSCDGLGLARQLHDLQIPQTIVMREPVPDYVAQEFLKYFLTAFARGKSFYLAVREARERLQGLESDYPCASWLPMIYQNLAQVPPTWQDLIQEPEPEIEVTDNPPNPPSQGGSKNDETVSLLSSPQSPWRGWQKVLLASVVVTSLVMGVRSLGWLQPVELKAFDQLMQLRPDEGPDPRLLVVAVTEEDLRLPEQQQRKGSLSDSALYRLLQKLESYQPKVIGLDIFRDFSVDSKLAGLRTYLQQKNHFFAICHPSVLGEERDRGISRPPDIPKERQGFSNILPDSDGIVRRHLLSMDVSATSLCSASKALNVQLALHYLKSKGITPQFTSDGNWQLGKVVFKRLQAPTGVYQKADTGGNQVILNYRSYRSPKEIAEIVTLTDVLTGKVNPEVVNNRIILIGAMHSTSDYFPSPYSQDSQEIPGVMLHAQMVSQIISAVLEQRPLIKFWSWWWEVLWIWSWSLIGGVLVWRLQSIRLLIVGGVTLGILCGLSYYLLIQGYWVPLIPSALAIVATGGSVVAYSKGRDWTIGLLTSKYGKSCLF